jgi:hypothetical protein
MLACSGQSWHHLAFEYPAEQKEAFDQFVTRASYALSAYDRTGCPIDDVSSSIGIAHDTIKRLLHLACRELPELTSTRARELIRIVRPGKEWREDDLPALLPRPSAKFA